MSFRHLAGPLFLAALITLGCSAAPAYAATYRNADTEFEYEPCSEEAWSAVNEGYTELGYTMQELPRDAEAAHIYRVYMGLDLGTFAETGIPAVALTFDDGPSKQSDRILDVLEKYNSHATFFIIGEHAANRPETLKRELALGCELGSHSWNHPQLTTLSEDEIRSQMSRSVRAIEESSGGKVTVMRPPYGSVNGTVKQTLELPIILWSLDTLDWKTRDTASTVKTVKKQISGGQIVLFHDLYEPTADAIEELVPWLVEEGYRLLTVSELYEYYEEDLDLHSKHSAAA